MKTDSLMNVTLLRAGGELSERDLADIADAARAQDFRAAVAIGPAAPGQPAYGFVERVRKVGSALYGDLVNLPAEVAAALRGGKVRKIACSVFQDLVRGGRKFRRALQRVTLEGIGAPPLNLVPSGTVEFIANEAAVVRVFSVDFVMGEPADRRAVGDEVAARVEELQRSVWPQKVSYADALARVLREDPDLAERYAHGPRATVESNAADPADPVHVIVDREARKWMVALGVSYDQALARALSERPDLAAAYSEFGFREEGA